MPKTLMRRRVRRVERLVLLRAPRDLEVHQPQEVEARVDAGEVELHPRLIDDAAAVGELRLPSPSATTSSNVPFDHAGAAQRDALVVELVGDQLPAAVELADQVADRHADVVVERLVGVHARPCS